MATEGSCPSLTRPNFQSNDNQFLWELIGGPPKTRNMSACWQDGRFFAENETWVVDSCTKCTCKVRPAARAPQPLALAGQPALAGRWVWGSRGGYMNASLSSQKFKTVCHQISCPPVTCANPSLLEGDCCPSCFHCECGAASLSSARGGGSGRTCPGTLYPLSILATQ